MSHTKRHLKLEEEQASLTDLQKQGLLLPEEEKRLQEITGMLQSRTTGVQKNIRNTLTPKTPEEIVLPGTTLVFDKNIQDQQRAAQALGRIGLPHIQETLVKMTGYTPTNMPKETRLHSNTNPTATQAGIVARAYTPLTHDPLKKRLRLRFHGLSGIDAIDGNVHFIEANPDEARGVYYHELGHLWTPKMYALDDERSETYIEAFGELFRSAAALHEGAAWKQATGCRGYDILSGDTLPNLVIPHWQNLNVPKLLFHSGRFAVCNRLIQHLGGLNERVLHGIAKACDIGTLPYDGDSFEHVLRDIERETEVAGFADAVLADPALRFGGMQTGPVMLGFPTADQNGYRIDCFNITDTGAAWGMSKEKFDAQPQSIDVNNSTFDFKGVQVQPIPFNVTFHNEPFDVNLKMNVTSGEILVTPEQILDLALMGKTGWPGGKTTITFSVGNGAPKKIATEINISEEMRTEFQKKRGVTFQR